MIDGIRPYATITPLITPRKRADRHRHEHGDEATGAEVVAEHVTGDVGADPGDRPDGQVDVAGDDHQRLPGGDHRRHGDTLRHPVEEATRQVVVDEEAEADERDDDEQQQRQLLDPFRADRGDREVGPVMRRPLRPSPARDRPRRESKDRRGPRPSRITTTRSLIARTSGRSEEMTMTAMPSRARSSIRWWTSALAPTSMPRVGSSRMSTRGSTLSQLSQHRLLLVAARQVADRREQRCGADAQPIAEALGRAPLGTPVEQPERRAIGAERGQRDVRGDRLGHRQAQLAAVLGQIGDAEMHGIARVADGDDSSVDGDSCRDRRGRCRTGPARRRCARRRRGRRSRRPRRRGRRR